MHATEIRWAPHLISVELIRALVLVAIASGRIVDALEKSIASLEAEFAIEVVVVGVSQDEKAIVT